MSRTTLDIPAYAVIIRAIHERGQSQEDALAELTRRGLWLTTEQRREAGLSDREGWTKPAHLGDAVRITYLERDDHKELGDVRIQQYDGRYRVAMFLPGVSVCLPGDTPKTEPESSQWCDIPGQADGLFELFVEQALAEGWKVRPWSQKMEDRMPGKRISLPDFLTPDEIKRAVALYEKATPGTFAAQCEAEIIKPNLARINTAIGQKNDARYLAYVVELVLMLKRPPAPSVRR